MGFDTDIELRQAAPDTFDADVPAHWRVGRGATNGGYLAAVITRALERAVADPERHARSLTIHYTAACGPGPVRVTVARERQGRSLTTLSARMTQGESTVALALAAFGQSRPGIDFQHEPMPEAPPPEAVPVWGGIATGGPGFPVNWEYRLCVGAPPFSRASEAVSGGWIRLAEPAAVLDAAQIAAMADAWLPPVLLLADRPQGLVPTIDLTVHFRAALPLPGATAADFSFAVFQARVGAEGYWESDGLIWSRDGRVLAQARQLAVFNLRA
ncbi:MAG TPA: thioesterase family protein [Candidatus Dormibacteraeota bacterium]|nr:thioesterase family protein [Candidatus Dormibacteraeota bacterium]